MCYLPTSALCFLAIPELITTQQQTLRACVGDTVFVPSNIQVSALADNVEVAWFRVGKSGAQADNGAVTANYSHKVENVSMSDEDHYFATVTGPYPATVQGPAVELIVAERPGEFLVTVRKHHHVCKSMSGVNFHAMVLK